MMQGTIANLIQSDYHLVLPNLRGFGGSEHPPTARSGSSMGELVGDLVCVLTELRVEKVLCVGSVIIYQCSYEYDMYRAYTGMIGALRYAFRRQECDRMYSRALWISLFLYAVRCPSRQLLTNY